MNKIEQLIQELCPRFLAGARNDSSLMYERGHSERSEESINNKENKNE